MRPEPAEHLDAIETGQHQVEDDEVRWGRLGHPQGRGPVRGAVDVGAGVAQVTVDDLGDEGVVVDDEHTGHPATIGKATAVLTMIGSDVSAS